MQRLVFSLRVERNLAVGALWRIAGTPVGAVDLTMIERAEARVAELTQRVEELEQQYARFAADTYEQEGCGPGIVDDRVRLMAWVMGGGDPDDPDRPGPPG